MENQMTPPEVEFEPMTGDALAAWLERSRADYVAERMASGDSAAEAEGNADASFERLMPGGIPAPGQLIGHVRGPDGVVGHLWLGPAGSDPARWWVWDVAIEPEFRGRGLGRAAMELADVLARAHGANDDRPQRVRAQRDRPKPVREPRVRGGRGGDAKRPLGNGSLVAGRSRRRAPAVTASMR
jgi:GNAT superfamily N-acetyltransferase